MEFRIPKKGEIYRHFKGNLYEIIIIARDSESLEEKVVYKEVDGDSAYVRSLPMFVSLVDKEKYPNAGQEFRFELVSNSDTSDVSVVKSTEKSSQILPEEEIQEKISLGDQTLIMNFLDLNTVDEKIQYLFGVKDKITSEFITVAAQSLDFVETKEELQDRYHALLNYLKTVAKYERGRLR